LDLNEVIEFLAVVGFLFVEHQFEWFVPDSEVETADGS
jgi:hypothetical protein